MYYVIEISYTGINPEAHANADTVRICTTPATRLRSKDECLHGWCGTEDGWAVFAHGAYPTLDEARAAIARVFGEVRAIPPYGEDVVEAYQLGKYIQFNTQETADWAKQGMVADISAETTDEEIAELALEYEAQANSVGYTLDSDIEHIMRSYRKQLRDSAKKEERI